MNVAVERFERAFDDRTSYMLRMLSITKVISTEVMYPVTTCTPTREGNTVQREKIQAKSQAGKEREDRQRTHIDCATNKQHKQTEDTRLGRVHRCTHQMFLP